jgi:hypothetical protein
MSHLFIRIAMLFIKAAARFAPKLDTAALRAHLPLLRLMMEAPEQRRISMVGGADA